jgi:hypothetical protein
MVSGPPVPVPKVARDHPDYEVRTPPGPGPGAAGQGLPHGCVALAREQSRGPALRRVAPFLTPRGCPHVHNPQATVDKVHAQVMEALQQLYDRHKASYGWADRPLSIE